MKSIKQANRVTNARYDYSSTEKKIMYFIILQLQRFDIANIPTEEATDMHIIIDYKALDPEGTNVTHVKKALKNLQNKEIEIENLGGKKDDFFTGRLINWGEKRNGKIKISLSSYVAKLLLDTAKGFTVYNIIVALSLKSVYSQRLYELCNRFKDTGIYKTNIEDLKLMFSIEDVKAYNNYYNFKKNVLIKAEEELKSKFFNEESDIYFELEEKRKGRGRGGKVEQLIFHIKTKGKEVTANNSEAFNHISTLLFSIYKEKKDKPLLKNLLNKIIERKDLDEIYKALCISIENADNPKAYVRTVLKNNFKIE